MSTNSTIAVLNTNGTVTQIYCHWDGYLEYNGRMLVENYATLELATKLVKKGDLSSLGTTVGRKHEFGTKVDCCTYYGRDRGEKSVNAKKFKSIADFEAKGRSEEYNYLLIDGIWYYKNYNRATYTAVTDDMKIAA